MINIKYSFFTLSFLMIVNVGWSQTLTTSTVPTCTGEETGSITIDLDLSDTPEYTLPFNFSLENTTEGSYDEYVMTTIPFIINDLEGGIYNIEIFLDDETIYTSEQCTEIESEIDIILDAFPPCNGDGSISLIVDGGDGAYTYDWEDIGSGSDTRSGLVAGSYTVTVTDGNDCSAEASVDLVAPFELPVDPLIQLPCSPKYSNGYIWYTYLPSGYSLLWSDGSTGNLIANLTPGQYCSIITDDQGCSLEKCFQISPFSSSGAQFINTQIEDSCPTNGTGSISFELSQGLGLNFINWNDLSWWESGNKKFRENLSPGTYSVTVTGACDLNLVKSFTVGVDCVCLENAELQIHKFLPCPGQSNGEIGIYGIENIDQNLISYKWSNGGAGALISNLSPGTYSVTLSDNTSGCEKITSIVLEEYELLVQANTIVNPSCLNSADGTIEVDFYGGQPSENQYMWSDDGISRAYYRQRIVKENVLPGEYTLTISNDCESVDFMYTIEEIEIEITTESTDFTCNPDQIVDLVISVSGDNPPFSYAWSNGNITNELIQVPYGTYMVTVTDAIGCEKVEEFILYEIDNIVENNACEGIDDGSYSFDIDNPNNEPVTAWVGIPPDVVYTLVDGETTNPVHLNFGNLEAEKEYTIHIRVGDCLFQYTFSVGEDEWDYTYDGTYTYAEGDNSGDEIVVCDITWECNDNPQVPGTIVGSTVNNSDPDDCCGSVDIYCGEVFIEDKEVKRKGYGRAQIEYLYLNDPAAPPREFWVLRGDNACDRFRTCPNKPYLCRRFRFSEPLIAGSLDRIEDLGNGCLKYHCKGLIPGLSGKDYTVCPDGNDILPDWMLDYQHTEPVFIGSAVGDDCKSIHQHRLGELLDNASLWNDPGFTEGAELYDVLVNLENNWPPPPGWSCAKIQFCYPSFEIIQTYDPDCESTTQNLQTDYDAQQGGCQEVYCCDNADNSWNGLTYMCNDDINWGIQGDDKPDVKIIQNNSYNTQFLGFSPTIIDKTTNYPACFMSSGSSSFYQAFNSVQQYVLEATDDYSWYVTDVREDEITAFEPLKGNEINVVREKEWQLWNKSLKGVRFNTQLKYNTSLISSSDSKGAFNNYTYLISQIVNSEYIAYHLSKEIDIIEEISIITDNILFEKSNNVVFKSNSNSVYVYNNISTVVKSSDEIMRLNIDGSNSTSVISDGLKLTGDIRIIDFKNTTGGEYFLIQGTGTFGYDLEPIQINREFKLVKVQDGNISWTKSLQDNNSVMPTCIEISTEKVYLGTNLIGITEIDGHNFITRGSSDILIFELDIISGNITDTYHFGNSGHEIVQELYFNEIVYIGGTINSNEKETNIGEIKFLDFSRGYSHGFMSYIIPEKSEGTLKPKQAQKRTSKNGIEDQLDFEILPNPGVSDVTILLDYEITNSSLNAQFYNSTGELVQSFELSGPETKFAVGSLPKGVYYVRIVDSLENLSTTRKFVRM